MLTFWSVLRFYSQWTSDTLCWELNQAGYKQSKCPIFYTISPPMSSIFLSYHGKFTGSMGEVEQKCCVCYVEREK